jgi:nucleoside-diphosphate-sugar epimerase
MKVFVTGATGTVGPATVRALVAAGHAVRAVARDESRAAAVRGAGAEPVAVDLFDAEAVRDATVGCDAIAHLATNVPAVSRAARRGAWATHNRLRTEATRCLVAAARAHDVGVFVKESVSFVYPDRGDAWIDESVPPLRVGLLAPTLEGEELVTSFGATGARGVVLRFGLFYGPTSRGVDEGLRLARWRASTVAGAPGAYLSSIHSDDVATAVVAALDAPGGVYNVVDDDPLTRRQYLDAFAHAFGLKRLRPTPALLVRVFAGSAASALLASQRVANGRFRGATGWAPAHRDAREGWASVAAARRLTGATR